uniref:PHTF1/2 N-terminal domain-containing protein n=1 Tax=Photinus pyralis TaxID=7054 RepID=A0A1Y1N4T8_PHOPY
MGIDQFIGWYQKKIGTYDRQLWEKTIEQRIHHGLTDIRFPKNSIHLKSTNAKERDDCEADLKMKSLKTEFIDIDLVRGSSFTKAKPKHGIITVVRLASLRFLLLPLYSKWWVQQTSGKIFLLLLSLYILQLFNIAVYSYNTSKLSDDSTEYVPCTEIVVPVIMMWVLSFIHSQIMATQSDHHPPSQTQKRKNFRRRRKSKIPLITRSFFDCNNQKHRSKDSNEKGETGKTVVFQEHICTPQSGVEDILFDHGFESFKTAESIGDCRVRKNTKYHSTNTIDSNGNNGSESDISHDENQQTINVMDEKLSRQLNHGRSERRHLRSIGKLKLINSTGKEGDRVSVRDFI